MRWGGCTVAAEHTASKRSNMLGREADDRLESVTKGTIYCSPTLLKTSFEKGYRKSNVGVFVRRFLGFARRSRNWHLLNLFHVLLLDVLAPAWSSTVRCIDGVLPSIRCTDRFLVCTGRRAMSLARLCIIPNTTHHPCFP